MSAIIETIIDDQNHGDYWIEKKVIRVGSGSDCDVRLEQSDIPSHVATVRFRNGQYVVYNRSGAQLAISDRTVDHDNSLSWHANERLMIAPDVSLQLLVDGNPAPCPCPDNEILESYQQKRSEERRLKTVQETEAKENEILEESQTRKSKPKSSQFAIGVFMLGLAALALIALGAVFLFGLAKGLDSKPAFKPSGVAKSLLARSSELPPQLVSLLQEAQQSVELKDRESAKSRLKRLQSELERMKANGEDLTISQGDQRVSYEDALRAYINEFLSQLE